MKGSMNMHLNFITYSHTESTYRFSGERKFEVKGRDKGSGSQRHRYMTQYTDLTKIRWTQGQIYNMQQ